MKKFALIASCLMATMSIFAEKMYVKDASTGFYAYTGDSVTTDIVWDFTRLTASDARYAEPNVFADTLIEFENLGMYKYGYYASRPLGDKTYGPVMWNSGVSYVNGVKTNNNTIATVTDFPAVYFPVAKNGIKYIAYEGWGNGNPANITFMKRGANGTWEDIQTMVLNKNTYTVDTLWIRDTEVKEVMFHRIKANNAWQYITKITLGVMSEEIQTEVVLDKKTLTMYPGKVSTITASVLPAGSEIVWSSSDDAIATVDNGTITAISKGTAQIYAAVGDVKESCAVTVEAYDQYTLGADGYFHYTGAPYDDFSVDFTQDLSSTEVRYSNPSAKEHADLLLEFQDLGLYKWCWYGSRKCGDVTYDNLLWNGGISENGKNGNVAENKRPMIYFPAITNGVKRVIVEGWTNKDRNLIFMAENAAGEWKSIKEVAPSMTGNDYITLKSTYTTATLEVNSTDVKRIMFWRNSTDYQFITKIIIEPMEAGGATKTNQAVDETTDSVEKIILDGNLYIRHNGVMYNVLGQRK